jgi:hypothetical protein
MRIPFVAVKITTCAVVIGLFVTSQIAAAQYGAPKNPAPPTLEQEIRRVEAEIDKIFGDTLSQLPSIPQRCRTRHETDAATRKTGAFRQTALNKQK